MSLRDWPIKQKLTAMLVLISGLVLLLTSAAFAGYQYWSLRQATRDALAVRGRIIAANSTASLAFANDADARELLSALRADPHIVAAVLYDKSGHLFAAYPAYVAGDVVPAAPGRHRRPRTPDTRRRGGHSCRTAPRPRCAGRRGGRRGALWRLRRWQRPGRLCCWRR